MVLSDVTVDGVATIPLCDHWRGWWSKMELFGPDVEPRPTLFLDLDTVLVGDCTELIASLRGVPFAILRDVYRGRTDPRAMQSSVMYWERDMRWLFDGFAKEAETIIDTLRGDQDYLERALSAEPVRYLQDISPCFASYKADIQRRGLRPSDRVIVFHGRPRPWDAGVPVAVSMKIGKPLDMRKTGPWVVPAHDKVCLAAALKQRPHLDLLVSMSKGRRTAVQAGGNFGIWPARLAETFARVLTFEPEARNFAALQQNTVGLTNLTAHHAALGAVSGRAGMVCVDGNAGAHRICLGDEVEVMTVDSFGLTDCDLIQFDLEGHEHQALLGAAQTIARSRPVIALEMKGLGRRYGTTDAATTELLRQWGYTEQARRSRDVFFVPSEATAASPQVTTVEQSDPPVKPDETCVLVGNGPGALIDGDGSQVDAFDQVVRFNHFKLDGYENRIGSKTTLYATFGRGMMPQDTGCRPARVLFIHGDNGNPAWTPAELWRIPLSFYAEVRAKFDGCKNTRGGDLLPSTGLLVTLWLLHTGVKQIHLLGFDHFAQHRSNHHHYWANRAFKKPAEHDGAREREIFTSLADAGQVVYLRKKSACSFVSVVLSDLTV